MLPKVIANGINSTTKIVRVIDDLAMHSPCITGTFPAIHRGAVMRLKGTRIGMGLSRPGRLKPYGIVRSIDPVDAGNIEIVHHPLQPDSAAKLMTLLEDLPPHEIELVFHYWPYVERDQMPSFSSWPTDLAHRMIYPRIHRDILVALGEAGMDSGDFLVDPACGAGELDVQAAQHFDCRLFLGDLHRENVEKTEANLRRANVAAEAIVTGDCRAFSFPLPQNGEKVFVVLSGLLTHSVLDEQAAKQALFHLVQPVPLGSVFIVTGGTPVLFRSAEFRAFGFTPIRHVTPACERQLYVLRKDFTPDEDVLKTPLEMGREMAILQDLAQRAAAQNFVESAFDGHSDLKSKDLLWFQSS